MRKLFTLTLLALALTACSSPQKACKPEPHTNPHTQLHAGNGVRTHADGHECGEGMGR